MSTNLNESIMKREIVSDIIKNIQFRLDYLDKVRSVDCSLTDVFDNAYINSLHDSHDMLVKLHFGEVMYNEIMWFLHDRPHDKDGDEIIFDVGNLKRIYKITNLESFLDYLEDCGTFDEKKSD